MEVAPLDELRHEPGPGDWQESWSFDLAAPDASLGASVRLALDPATGHAWFWAAVVGPDRPTVALRDHDVEAPRGDGLELRAPGLWTDLVCEEPLDHWSIGLEAFAVAFEDPLDAWSDERGAPTPMGFDLGWEASEPPRRRPADAGVHGYEQACRVNGEVLVGAERLTIDGWGARRHAWGPRRWHEPGGSAWARLDDGRVSLHRPVRPRFDGTGLPVAMSVALDDAAEATASPRGLALVRVPRPGGPDVRLVRFLCRYDDDGGGVGGVGWAGWRHGAD